MPNILITGTPGVGKSSLVQALAQRIPTMNVVDVGREVAQKELHEGRDEEWDCWIIDEDKVVDELEPVMASRNNIVDHHSCGFFPERWFDLVVVLRAENDILYPRLEKRNYAPKKITENVTAEIMQVVLDEAHESYKEDIVWELPSNSLEDMDQNLAKITAWIQSHQ